MEEKIIKIMQLVQIKKDNTVEFLEEAMKIQCVVSCRVIMLMIDSTTVAIVCWAVPNFLNGIGCDVFVFFHGIK